MNDEGKSAHVFSVIPMCGGSIVDLIASELVEYFRARMREDPDMASAVAAIRTLLEFLKRNKGLSRLAAAVRT